MSVNEIVRIAPGHGETVVPDVASYQAVSADWREVEHRGPAPLESLIGFWEGEGGSARLAPWPYDELCVLLSGRVALVDDEGGRVEFGAGESFFIPRSFSGRWETIEPTTKVFVGFGAFMGEEAAG